MGNLRTTKDALAQGLNARIRLLNFEKFIAGWYRLGLFDTNLAALPPGVWQQSHAELQLHRGASLVW